MLEVFLLLAGILLLLMISGWYVFFSACVRRKEYNWLDEKEISRTPYAKYYKAILKSNQWLIDHRADDIYITSKDNLKLHALWIPAEKPCGTVILAHGYKSTMLADFSYVLDFYHAMGMNLLIPDQRCHGKSEGKYITFGVKESDDMLRWLEYHNRQFGDYPVILSGLSMGASTMLYLADADLTENVKGIIADCGFTSPKEIISHVFTSVTHLPAGPSVWAANLFAKAFAGFSLSEKDTRKSLANSKVPVFMIHGKMDDFVPCWMTEQGFDACIADKQVLLVEGADHGVSFLFDSDSYTNMLIAFLEKNIGGAQCIMEQ